jgi:beta-lactamase regulating signal transducer with metallopeptidase domain
MNFSPYLPLFADLMMKSAAVAMLACLATRCCRGASAANRHLVWLAAVGVLLALPFTTARVSSASSRTEGVTTVVVLELPARTSAPLRAAPMVAANTEPVPAGFRATADRLFGQWREGLVALWLGGAGLLLARRMFGAARLHVLKRRSEVVDDARIETWAARIARDNGLARSPELRISTAFPVAITWGTWRPVVMLPAGARDWSDARIELVLRHELAHVARRDCLARLLGQVACAFYWPNPLVWLAARHLWLAQEQACDDRVLVAGAATEAYATELLAGAKALSGRRWGGAAVAMAEPSTLEKRIVGIVDEGRDRGTAHRFTILGVMAAAGLALVGCRAIQVREPTPEVISAADEAVRQVEIEARFIDFKQGMAEEGPYLDSLANAGGAWTGAKAVVGYLETMRVGEDVRRLSKQTGADLISVPKVTLLDCHKAFVSVAEELRFPISWERISGVLTATDYDSREMGVRLSVRPVRLGGGTIILDLHGLVRELHGFVEGQVDEDGRLVAGKSADSEGYFVTPLFEERQAKATVRLEAGQTVVLRLGKRKMVAPGASGDWALAGAAPDAADERVVLVFVSAKEIDAHGSRMAPAAPPPGTTIVEVPDNPNLFRL